MKICCWLFSLVSCHAQQAVTSEEKRTGKNKHERKGNSNNKHGKLSFE